MISVILPVFNEQNNPMLPQMLQRFEGVDGLEKIAIDGGSIDDTVDVLARNGFRVLSLPKSSRAARMKAGIEVAQGDVVLLHHPRSVLSSEAFEWLKNGYDQTYWGGFWHQFDKDHWLLKFTSWYSNNIRSENGILYLDHCLFFPKRALPNTNVIPDVEIFEDTEISKILTKKLGPPEVIPIVSLTSSIRFQKRGIFKQALHNQFLKIQYFLGASDKKMNKEYEKDLGLNN